MPRIDFMEVESEFGMELGSPTASAAASPGQTPSLLAEEVAARDEVWQEEPPAMPPSSARIPAARIPRQSTTHLGSGEGGQRGSPLVGPGGFRRQITETDLPPILQFLANPLCNPDFSDDKLRRIGFVEKVRDQSDIAAELAEFSIVNGDMSTGAYYHQGGAVEHGKYKDDTANKTFRGRVGQVVSSMPVQFLVFLTIMFDLAVLIKNFAENDHANYSSFDEMADIVVLAILGTEVLARLYSRGWKFFRGASGLLNSFELMLVPLTLIQLILHKTEIPVSVLRVLRPLFRSLRVVRIIVRGFRRGSAFKQTVRRRVAGHRLRYTKDGFDLDLAYIGKGREKQVIATSIPATGYEALYRNSVPELAKFLNERHTNRYLLINLTEEKKYPLEPFFFRYLECPISLNGVPSMKQTWELCGVMKAWLSLDPSHVVCIHSKNGRGRVGLIVSAYFLYLGIFQSAATAIAFFERCRVDEEAKVRSDEAGHPKSVDTPSQARFLEYFCKLMKARARYGNQRVEDIISEPRAANLVAATIQGLPGKVLGSLEMRCFTHPLGRSLGLRTEAEALDGTPTRRTMCQGSNDEFKKSQAMRTFSVKPGVVVNKAINRLTSIAPGAEVGEIIGQQSSKDGGAVQRADIKVPPQRSARHQALMARIHSEMESSGYDTIQSGGMAETAIPVVTTRNIARHTDQTISEEMSEDLRSDASGSRHKPVPGLIARDMGDEAVVFTFEGVSVSGEVKVELHCKQAHITAGVAEEQNRKKKRRFSKLKKQAGKVLGFLRKKKEVLPWTLAEEEEEEQQENGKNEQMLVSLWLHTDFLEGHSVMSKTAVERIEERNGNSVMVVLRRFDMDKAAGAPKLWSYSTSFEVQLEFQYEFRDAAQEGLDEEVEAVDLMGLAEFDSVPAAKMTWINWCIRRMWHHCEPAVRNILLELIMPMLNEFIPGALKPVSLKDFSLGSAHPVLGPMMIASKAGHDPELQMDCMLSWDGDVTALLDVGGYAEVGISRVTVKGIIALKLNPFIEHIPIIGGLEFFFLNAPQIDLKFAGQLELANISLLRPAILEAVKSAVSKKLVLPNVIKVDIQPESRRRGDPIISFRDVRPLAILRIKVMEAMRLRGADWSLWSRTRTSDPYCVLQFGAANVRTRVIEKTTEPVWNEAFDLLLHDWKQSLEVSVFDYDFGKQDDLLGRIKALPCLTLLAASVQGLWIPLEDVPQYGANEGPIGSQVLLSAEVLQFNHQKADYDQLKEEMQNLGLNVVVSMDEHPQAVAPKSAAKCSPTAKEWQCTPTCPDPFAPPRTKRMHLLDREVEIEGEDHGPVALFTFQIQAAQIPTALIAHTADAVVHVSCGKATVSRFVTPKKYNVAQASLSGEVQAIIESLARSRLSSREIREIVNQDGPSVQRLIEKGQGFNAEITTRLHLLVTLEDLAQAKEKIVFAIKVKNNTLAVGSMPLSHIGHASNLQAGQLVKCHSVSHRERETAILDVDASLAILGHFDLNRVREMADQVAAEQHDPLMKRMAGSASAGSRPSVMLSSPHANGSSGKNHADGGKPTPSQTPGVSFASSSSSVGPAAKGGNGSAPRSYSPATPAQPVTAKVPWSTHNVRAHGDPGVEPEVQKEAPRPGAKGLAVVVESEDAAPAPPAIGSASPVAPSSPVGGPNRIEPKEWREWTRVSI